MGFFKRTHGNIKAVMERDPAARHTLEVILCYPGVWALIFHSLSHTLYKGHLKLLARIVSQLGRWFTGIEIHPGATIGQRCFIDHGMGVVIGETAEVGDDVTIYQGVTLGGTGKETGKRHPTIGNGAVISAGAAVLGSFRIGDNSKVGAGSVVLKEVPDGCTAVGIPATLVNCKDQSPASELDQIHLPNPVEVHFKEIEEALEVLRNSIITEKKDMEFLKKTINEDEVKELKKEICELEKKLK